MTVGLHSISVRSSQFKVQLRGLPRMKINNNHPIRLMTECFRVRNALQAPLIQMPPQKGFPTVQPSKDSIPLIISNETQIGFLYPIFNHRVDACLFDSDSEDTPVCIVAQSHSPMSKIYEISNRQFPETTIVSFLCDVSYGVQFGDMKIETVVSGPRMVEIGQPYISDDGLRTVDLEIIEMYLSGYARNGVMITVRGGKNFGLPPIPGQAKAITKASDFPANLYFDLTLEVAYWGEVQSLNVGK